MKRFIPVLFVGLVAAGCGGSKAAPAAKSPASAKSSNQTTSADRAIAELLPTANGGRARAMVAMHMENGALTVIARVQNLKYGGYALAVHVGDKCVPPDAKSAGAIFNPDKADKPTGLIGDLQSKSSDNQTIKMSAKGLSLSGPNSIIGHTLVLDAWPYDPKTPESKVPFLACGRIRPDVN